MVLTFILFVKGYWRTTWSNRSKRSITSRLSAPKTNWKSLLIMSCKDSYDEWKTNKGRSFCRLSRSRGHSSKSSQTHGTTTWRSMSRQRSSRSRDSSQSRKVRSMRWDRDSACHRESTTNQRSWHSTERWSRSISRPRITMVLHISNT